MNTKVTKENIEEPSSETDPEKAENEEYRNYKEEPGDDDGENRHPEKRASVTLTGLFITKAMIGSGLLNVPFIFKTLGIFFGLFASIFFNFVSVLSCYFLLRCKDITQRYSYSIYSKLTMGLLGTITCKIAIVIRSFSLCCVLLKICGKILRTLLLIFFSEYSNRFFLNGEFLAVVLALIIMPTMFQKDISGVSKFTSLGIFSILFLFFSLVILFIFKITQNEIKPYEQKMLYLEKDFYKIFKCFGSYLNAYVFQVNFFPIYLPLHPRSTKNMIKSTLLGTMLSSVLYISFGIIGFIIYRYNINDTLLNYLGDDLILYLKTNKLIATLLIVFEIAFITNTTISTMLNFFVGKSCLIGLIKFIMKNIQNKLKKNDNKDIPLVDLDEKGISVNNNEKKENDNILNETSKTLITLLAYLLLVFIAYASDNIISIDNFNGSTVNNYLSLMLPALFFIILSKDKGFSFEKLLAIFQLLLSVSLITGYFLLNFIL